MSKSLPIETTLEVITLDGREVTIKIKKLPFGKVIDLLGAVQRLPEQLTNLDKMPESEIVANIATLIAAALPQFVGIIVRAIDDESVDQAFLLESCGADTIIEIIYTIIEINNIIGIINTLKKVQALTSPKPVATPTSGSRA